MAAFRFYNCLYNHAGLNAPGLAAPHGCDLSRIAFSTAPWTCIGRDQPHSVAAVPEKRSRQIAVRLTDAEQSRQADNPTARRTGDYQKPSLSLRLRVGYKGKMEPDVGGPPRHDLFIGRRGSEHVLDWKHAWLSALCRSRATIPGWPQTSIRIRLLHVRALPACRRTQSWS